MLRPMIGICYFASGTHLKAMKITTGSQPQDFGGKLGTSESNFAHMFQRASQEMGASSSMTDRT